MYTQKITLTHGNALVVNLIFLNLYAPTICEHKHNLVTYLCNRIVFPTGFNINKINRNTHNTKYDHTTSPNNNKIIDRRIKVILLLGACSCVRQIKLGEIK